MADQPTTTTAPSFVRERNDEDYRIIRVSDTPDDYISIDGVLYLEEQPEPGEEADWQQLSEKYLRKGSETTLTWLGANHQSNSGYFPDALAYRLQGEPGEFSKAEILSHINSWDASFSGYTFWDGSNHVFQHTADELDNWASVALELDEVASYQHWGVTYTLYLGQRDGDTDYYLGRSQAGGERLECLSLDEVAEQWPGQQGVMKLDLLPRYNLSEILTEAAEYHLRYPDAQQRAVELAGLSERNLFAERLEFDTLAELLRSCGADTSAEQLRAEYERHGTLL